MAAAGYTVVLPPPPRSTTVPSQVTMELVMVAGFTSTAAPSQSPTVPSQRTEQNGMVAGFTSTAAPSQSPTVPSQRTEQGKVIAAYGGGIYFSSGSLTITNSTISSNWAADGDSGGGGGIYCGSSSSFTITNSTISYNQTGTNAFGYGGGIYGSPTITNSTISYNKAGENNYGYRGGICGSPTITNCIISYNSAGLGGGGNGGGIDGSPTITNCTISNNSAGGYEGGSGGGIYGSPIVKNSILWGNNVAFNVSEQISPQASIPVTYSDIQGGWSGAGNIDSVPQFVNAAGGDFHLTATSPCIDSGTSDGAPATDIEGTPRPQNLGFDMGAYEYQGVVITTTTVPPITTTTTTIQSTTTTTTNIAFATPVPDTGQTKCYDSNGTQIPCSGTGQDGEIQAGATWPYPRFIANVDTTITDNLTGLKWAPDGNVMQTRDSGFDNDYTAGDGRVTWQHALNYVAKLNNENYLGYNDWRLPNVNELNSLANADEANLAAWLNSQGFTNVQSNLYLSSTTVASLTDYAWYVTFHDGYVSWVGKSPSNFYVWPVRAGQCETFADWAICLPKTGQTNCYDSDGNVIYCVGTGQDGEIQAGVAWPSPRFYDHGNGTVTDNLTGLMWTQNANPSGNYMTWQQALDYVKTVNTGGYNDWRLPNRNELRSLVDHALYNPALPLGHPFTNVLPSDKNYWSSTTNALLTDRAWIFYMYNGSMFYYL